MGRGLLVWRGAHSRARCDLGDFDLEQVRPEPARVARVGVLPSGRRRVERPAALVTVGVNLAVLVFCVAIGGLAVRFGRARARGEGDLRRLALLFGVVALFLLVNAAAAWLGMRSVVAALATPAVSSSGALRSVQAGDPVVVAGRLSARAGSDDPRYPAYFLCHGGSCDYHGPRPLPVTLDEGEVGVTGSGYARRGWRAEDLTSDESVVYLERESPLVVVGSTARGSTSPPEVEALVVYAGTHEAFRARARRSRAVAATLLGLDLLGALAAGVLAGWVARPRQADPPAVR